MTVVEKFEVRNIFIRVFLKLRLHAGLGAIFYVIFGFIMYWASFGLDPSVLTQEIIIRFMLLSFMAFLIMPFYFIVNDYFDAEKDAIDPIKKLRNYFCDPKIKNHPLSKIGLISLRS